MSDTQSLARHAIAMFPWAVRRWRKVSDLLMQVAEANDEEPLLVELRAELSDRERDMETFVAVVLPRADYPKLWAYHDPTDVVGTPIMEDWWDKTIRVQRSAVGGNPFNHVFPALLTNPFERVRALWVAEAILERARSLGANSPLPTADTNESVEATTAAQDRRVPADSRLSGTHTEILRLIRDLAPVPNEKLGDSLTPKMNLDAVRRWTDDLKAWGYIASSARGANNVQGWCLTGKGFRLCMTMGP